MAETEQKKDQEEITPQEIAEQASRPDRDQIQRQPLRGDETKGNPDERDVAGAVDHEDTPHGWEQMKEERDQGAETK